MKSIDKLYELRKQIKALQEQESELSKQIKEILIVKGIKSDKGKEAEAVLNTVNKTDIDNKECFSILGSDKFIKVSTVSKKKISEYLSKEEIQKISILKGYDYRLNVKPLNK